MAADLQEVFNRIRETKKEQKEIRKLYRDALDSSQEYRQIVEKFDNLKVRKKQIENEVKQDAMANFQKLDALRMHVKNDQEMLTDLAINKLLAGETVELTDQDSNKYEPIFSVNFKKT